MLQVSCISAHEHIQISLSIISMVSRQYHLIHMSVHMLVQRVLLISISHHSELILIFFVYLGFSTIPKPNFRAIMTAFPCFLLEIVGEHVYPQSNRMTTTELSCIVWYILHCISCYNCTTFLSLILICWLQHPQCS